MRKNLYNTRFIRFGLLLFFALLISFIGWNTSTVKAANVEVEKEGDYQLYVKSIKIVKGKSFTLKVKNLTEKATVIYKSGDEKVASINENGEIAATAVGTTSITATVKNGTVTTDLPCEVTVGLPAFSVKLTKSRMILGFDKTDFLNVILKPSDTVEEAKFSSKNALVATVSTGGRITAKKKVGLTYVFAEIDAVNADGTPKFSCCTVIVTSPEDAPLLEAYFNDHPEFDYIAADDFTKALDEFFNTKYDSTSSTSLVNSLNSYLSEKFDLKALLEKRAADLAKLQSK